MRNSSLVKLAEESICASTSKIYAVALRELEMETRACRDQFNNDEIFDDDPDMSTLPQVSTGTLVDVIKDFEDFASAIAKVDTSPLGPTRADHPKKRRKKKGNGSEDEVMVDGDASSDEDDEDDDDSDSDISLTSVSHDSNEVNGNADYNADARPIVSKESHHETIRNHLLLLARHPHGFLVHFPESPNEPERWTVMYRPSIKKLTHHAVLETITARYGMPAARLTRLLSEKGKVDEKNLQSHSLMNQKTMRSYLTTLHRAGMIQLQEVPRDNSRNPQRTMFLWYFDIERCKTKLLQEVYKTMARCLQRASVEGDKVKGTVEKATRSDVVGREEELLAPQELEALIKWRDVEGKIWGEVGRLDDLVAILRDF